MTIANQNEIEIESGNENQNEIGNQDEIGNGENEGVVKPAKSSFSFAETIR